jgi:hypothetical protein
MDESLKFFEKVTGRPPSPAEQVGDISLDVVLQLVDARIADAIAQPEEEEPAEESATVEAPAT